jgi:streptomycin 6-kinase
MRRTGWARVASADTVSLPISEGLAKACRRKPEHTEWLRRLPDTVRMLQRRWALELGAPYTTGMCAWVAPGTRSDGTRVALKLGVPHMEARDEIAALRFWAGDATVRLIDADEALNAMLLERCIPGQPLRSRPETEQDVVIAQLLRRLWRRPTAPHPFRPLSAMAQHWIECSEADAHRWPDPGLTRQGLRLMQELAAATSNDVLLATDLHAGNVLAAEREPWLVIDPKPFVGDPAYDATQHLLNCPARLTADPIGMVRGFADLLNVESERVQLWTFARLVAEPRDDWSTTNETARALEP